MEMKSGIVEVLLHGEPVGVLTNGKKTGSATFRYYDDAPYDLSLSLPRSKKEFSVVETRNWFEGLLPEGDRHELLSKHFILSAVDYTGLLSEIGYECAGAVTFGSAPDYDAPFAGTDLEEVLTALPNVHDGASDSSLRSSLAGFQNKTAAYQMGSRWIVPDAGLTSTHIIKPESTRWVGMVDAEAWAMEIAGHAAKAADTSIIEVGGIRALASVRFDRFYYDGNSYAVHQEDLCQALGLRLEHKLATVGGNKKMTPSFRKLAAILSEKSEDPSRELTELVKQMTVTVVLGNTDAHAKNFGLIHNLYGNVSLSPMYDVVPVPHFIPSDTKLGMTVNDIFRIDRVKFYDLVQEAVSWGLEDSVADALVRDTVEAIADAIPAADAKYPGRPDGVQKMIRNNLMKFDITLGEDGTR
jgi:serine/threonine-protein kinase HipA